MNLFDFVEAFRAVCGEQATWDFEDGDDESEIVIYTGLRFKDGKVVPL